MWKKLRNNWNQASAYVQKSLATSHDIADDDSDSAGDDDAHNQSLLRTTHSQRFHSLQEALRKGEVELNHFDDQENGGIGDDLRLALKNAGEVATACLLIIKNHRFSLDDIQNEISDDNEKNISLKKLTDLKNNAQFERNDMAAVDFSVWANHLNALCDLREEVLRFYHFSQDNAYSFSTQPIQKLNYFYEALAELQGLQNNLSKFLKGKGEFSEEQQQAFNTFANSVNRLSAVTMVLCSTILSLKRNMERREDALIYWESKKYSISPAPTISNMTITTYVKNNEDGEEKRYQEAKQYLKAAEELEKEGKEYTNDEIINIQKTKITSQLAIAEIEEKRKQKKEEEQKIQEEIELAKLVRENREQEQCIYWQDFSKGMAFLEQYISLDENNASTILIHKIQAVLPNIDPILLENMGEYLQEATEGIQFAVDALGEHLVTLEYVDYVYCPGLTFRFRDSKQQLLTEILVTEKYCDPLSSFDIDLNYSLSGRVLDDYKNQNPNIVQTTPEAHVLQQLEFFENLFPQKPTEPFISKKDTSTHFLSKFSKIMSSSSQSSEATLVVDPLFAGYQKHLKQHRFEEFFMHLLLLRMSSLQKSPILKSLERHMFFYLPAFSKTENTFIRRYLELGFQVFFALSEKKDFSYNDDIPFFTNEQFIVLTEKNFLFQLVQADISAQIHTSTNSPLDAARASAILKVLTHILCHTDKCISWMDACINDMDNEENKSKDFSDLAKLKFILFCVMNFLEIILCDLSKTSAQTTAIYLKTLAFITKSKKSFYTAQLQEPQEWSQKFAAHFLFQYEKEFLKGTQFEMAQISQKNELDLNKSHERRPSFVGKIFNFNSHEDSKNPSPVVQQSKIFCITQEAIFINALQENEINEIINSSEFFTLMNDSVQPSELVLYGHFMQHIATCLKIEEDVEDEYKQLLKKERERNQDNSHNLPASLEIGETPQAWRTMQEFATAVKMVLTGFVKEEGGNRKIFSWIDIEDICKNRHENFSQPLQLQLFALALDFIGQQSFSKENQKYIALSNRITSMAMLNFLVAVAVQNEIYAADALLSNKTAKPAVSLSSEAFQKALMLWNIYMAKLSSFNFSSLSIKEHLPTQEVKLILPVITVSLVDALLKQTPEFKDSDEIKATLNKGVEQNFTLSIRKVKEKNNDVFVIYLENARSIRTLVIHPEWLDVNYKRPDLVENNRYFFSPLRIWDEYIKITQEEWIPKSLAAGSKRIGDQLNEISKSNIHLDKGAMLPLFGLYSLFYIEAIQNITVGAIRAEENSRMSQALYQVCREWGWNLRAVREVFEEFIRPVSPISHLKSRGPLIAESTSELHQKRFVQLALQTAIQSFGATSLETKSNHATSSPFFTYFEIEFCGRGNVYLQLLNIDALISRGGLFKNKTLLPTPLLQDVTAIVIWLNDVCKDLPMKVADFLTQSNSTNLSTLNASLTDFQKIKCAFLFIAEFCRVLFYLLHEASHNATFEKVKEFFIYLQKQIGYDFSQDKKQVFSSLSIEFIGKYKENIKSTAQSLNCIDYSEVEKSTHVGYVSYATNIIGEHTKVLFGKISANKSNLLGNGVDTLFASAKKIHIDEELMLTHLISIKPNNE